MASQLEDILPSFALDGYLLHRRATSNESELPRPPAYLRALGHSATSAKPHDPDYTESVFEDLAALKKKKMAVRVSVTFCKEPPELRRKSKQQEASKTYLPGDLVTGEVKVVNRSRSSVRFKAFLVSLEGTLNTPYGSHVLLRSLDVAACSHPGHIPLRVTGDAKWGDRDSDGAFYGLPPDRILKPGATYKKFFHFVVPHCLLDTTCPHQLLSHLGLPPTTEYTKYHVKARLVGLNHRDGIYYKEECREVSVGSWNIPLPAVSTAHQLQNFRRRMDGEEEEEYDEIARVYSCKEILDVPERLVVEARTVSGSSIQLTLFTHMDNPPDLVTVQREITETYVMSPGRLPISVDSKALLKQTFASRGWCKLRNRCLEESRHGTTPLAEDMQALGRLSCRSQTDLCVPLEPQKLQWKDNHAILVIPFENVSPSFQTCYIGRYYQAVLNIGIGGQRMRVVLPLTE